MPLYQPLPPVLTPASQQSSERSSAANLRAAIGTNVRPNPPRNLTSQSGPQVVLLTWNAPGKGSRPNGIVAWRVYLGNENTFVTQVAEPTRQATISIPAGTASMAYVSAVTQQGIESPKIPIRVTAGAPASAYPALPPGYASEPTGGGFRQTRVP